MGVWGVALDLSSVLASAQWDNGSLVLKVGLTFFMQHMWFTSQLVIHLSSIILSLQVAGSTTHELLWQGNICGAEARPYSLRYSVYLCMKQ